MCSRYVLAESGITLSDLIQTFTYINARYFACNPHTDQNVGGFLVECVLHYNLTAYYTLAI